jgi:hypothetical protein
MILKTLKNIREHFFVKFVLTFAVVIFLMSAMLAFFFMRHQSDVLGSHLIQRGKLITDMLAYNARLGVFAENRELLEDVATGVLIQESIKAVFIYNLDFQELMARKAGPETADFENVHPEDSGSHAENPVEAPYFIESEDEISFWAPVFSRPGGPGKDTLFLESVVTSKNGARIGHVRVVVSKDILKQQKKLLAANSVVLGFLFWFFGSCVMYLVVDSITGPLKRLTVTVNRMGRSGHFRKLTFKISDEIGKLADAFNRMSESILQRETDKTRLEEQLRQAQKMEAIGTLAGGIAHDFNNILGAIGGFTELGLLEVRKGSVLHEKFKEIEIAANRASELVKQILTFSRQEDEKLDPMLIRSVTKEVLKLLSPSIPPSIQVEQHIDADCGLVLSNATSIHQILMNLCNNAIHAMKETGGILKVTLNDVDIEDHPDARKAGFFFGRYQRLSVEDTGYGISPDTMEKMFDPFFTTKKDGEGTGMGLAVVHGIVTRHKGFMTVSSTPGQGSAFHVYLPLADLEQVPEIPEKGEDVPMGTGRILLVEDDPQLLQSTAGMLESLGYRVDKKTNGPEAVAFFQENQQEIHLILTDMAMPGVSGVTLAAELHRIRGAVPILLTTGYSEMVDEQKAFAMGFAGFLSKPVTRKVLAVTVKNLIKISR